MIFPCRLCLQASRPTCYKCYLQYRLSKQFGGFGFLFIVVFYNQWNGVWTGVVFVSGYRAWKKESNMLERQGRTW